MRLFSGNDFLSARFNDNLVCQCDFCKKEFLKTKRQIFINVKRGNKKDFCSPCCRAKSRNVRIKCDCLLCGKKFFKMKSEHKKSKNHFCSQSCSTTFNNQNKIYGIRRSKLEMWLEKELLILFPHLEFHFNRKDAINSELDIYIPSLKLAFELNGIFHYEPIYGKEKLSQIQNNDERKFQACLEREIELCIIDCSSLRYFKYSNAKKYLDIIIQVITRSSHRET